MTYADFCIDRASKAIPEPETNHDDGPLCAVCNNQVSIEYDVNDFYDDPICNNCLIEFAIKSRTQMVELATRLKRATQYLRLEANVARKDILNTIADELEAMPEGKNDKIPSQ